MLDVDQSKYGMVDDLKPALCTRINLNSMLMRCFTLRLLINQHFRIENWRTNLWNVNASIFHRWNIYAKLILICTSSVQLCQFSFFFSFQQQLRSSECIWLSTKFKLINIFKYNRVFPLFDIPLNFFLVSNIGSSHRKESINLNSVFE